MTRSFSLVDCDESQADFGRLIREREQLEQDFCNPISNTLEQATSRMLHRYAEIALHTG